MNLNKKKRGRPPAFPRNYELMHLFWQNKAALNSRETEIVDRYIRGQNFKEIGLILAKWNPQGKSTGQVGISNTRVQQIFDNAITKLRLAVYRRRR
jgi:DNA-directed RNA polymerase specialized sigma subunit